MTKFDRDEAVDSLARYFLESMDLKTLEQMAYEILCEGFAQETDADLLAQLTQHGLVEETADE